MDIQDQKARLQGELKPIFGRDVEIQTLDDRLVVFGRGDERRAQGSYKAFQHILALATDYESFWHECEKAGLLWPERE